MRLIDADELKKTIKAQQVIDREISPNATISYHNLNNIIDKSPTVEALKDIAEVHCDITKEQLLNALRPQGEWIFHKDYNESCRYGCNQCGNLNNISSNFCPNCGARMVKS